MNKVRGNMSTAPKSIIHSTIQYGTVGEGTAKYKSGDFDR